jgi:hypothetical protein
LFLGHIDIHLAVYPLTSTSTTGLRSLSAKFDMIGKHNLGVSNA